MLTRVDLEKGSTDLVLAHRVDLKKRPFNEFVVVIHLKLQHITDEWCKAHPTLSHAPLQGAATW